MLLWREILIGRFRDEAEYGIQIGSLFWINRLKKIEIMEISVKMYVCSFPIRKLEFNLRTFPGSFPGLRYPLLLIKK